MKPTIVKPEIWLALLTANGPFVTNQALAVGDVDGDGILDLATSVHTGGSDLSRIFIGRGDGTFSAGASYFSILGGLGDAVGLADLDNDGILDLLTQDEDAEVFIFRKGLGNGTFVDNHYTSLAATEFAVGDLNGDGILDLVTGDYYGNSALRVLLGNGDGTFAAATSYGLNGMRRPTLADFNGDGNLDIGAARGGTGYVLLGTGNGTFQNPSSFSIGGTDGFSVGDLNNDGVFDAIGRTIRLAATKDGVAPLLPFSLQTLADARQALPVFKRKREQLAAQRGEIGAFQSRIAVATNALAVSSENFRAAESRIRDADIADESSRLVRLNILQQAAAAVHAQANQQPALVLQLLQ